MATASIDSLRGILNGFRDLNSKGIYPMNATETDLLRQILLEIESLSLDGASDPSQIKSATAPTTRADGSALQTDDRWQDTANDRVWIRNAAGQWMSEQIFYLSNVVALTLGASNNSRLPYVCRYTGVIIETCELKYAAAAPQNSTDFWTMNASALTDTGITASSASFGAIHTTQAASTSVLNELSLKPNIYSDANTTILGAGVITNIGLSFIKSASAGNLSRLCFTIGVRDVY